MNDKVFSVSEKYNMISPGDRVVVALSGGSDSMTLLTVLEALRNRIGFTLEAAHVNHCLRGNDADSDEAFVKKICLEKNIKLHLLRADVAGEAAKTGESLEEAGRRIRYGFFASLGDDCKIATAHNLNDRVETFLFNFTRGSSLKGLCSIPPVRGNIIRPLIECDKSEILAYCEENNIEYCTDKTNSDVKYSRNRIRHNIIPEAEKLNPGFIQSAGRCIELLNEDEKFLRSMADELIEKSASKDGFSAEVLACAPVPVLSRAITAIIEKETGSAPDRTETDYVMGLVLDYAGKKEGKSIDIPGAKAITGSGRLRIIKNVERPVLSKLRLSQGNNRFGNYNINLSKYTDCLQSVPKSSNTFILDSDKIAGVVIADVRKSDDTISPPGRNITKPLRKLQNEKGIPPCLRDVTPVIRDDNGLIAAYGCGIDKRAAVTKETENILLIRIEEVKQ